MTEEEKKARKKEYARRYYAAHKEEIAAVQAAYRAENKDKIAAQRAEYRAANKEEIAAKGAAWRAAHKEEIAAYRAAYDAAHKGKIATYKAEYRAAHKEEIAAQRAAYYGTKRGRAVNIYSDYRKDDKNRGFDTSNNATAEWIEENIFSGQRCIYCGDSDWTHLGCDRIDNSKPHTPENCVPCCGICNMERSDKYSVEEFKEYRKLNPRTLDTGIEKSWEISKLPSGTKVIKKKSIPASA